MRIRYSSRLFLYAPFVVLLALALASVINWWHLENHLERQLVQANRGREIAPGVSLHFAAESIGGCPFNLDTVLDNVTLAVKAPSGPFVWHADRFAIHTLTYGRELTIFEAAGTQTLAWTDAEGEAHRFVFVPGSLRASAIVQGGRLVRFDLDLNGIGGREISGMRAQVHLRHSPAQDAIDVVASADALHLAPDLQTGFGADIARLSVAGRVRPATSLSLLLSGRDEWRNAANTWRARGGSFLLDRLDLAAGRIDAESRGAGSLDANHRPAGALDLTVVHAQDLSPADDSRLAGALLQLSKEDSSKGPLHVLVSIQGGSATVRRSNAPDTRVKAGSIDPLY
jgi:hypothetical protein